MKIGHSLGRCVRDIVEGKVDIDDVYVIVARTKIENLQQLSGVIEDYCSRDGYLRGLDFEECLRVAKDLFDRGLVHQPRKEVGTVRYTHRGFRSDTVWLDMVPTDYVDNPGLQSAWEAYQVALKLSQ